MCTRFELALTALFVYLCVCNSPPHLQKLVLLDCSYRPVDLIDVLLSREQKRLFLPELKELQVRWIAAHPQMTRTTCSDGDESSRAWRLPWMERKTVFVTQLQLERHAQLVGADKGVERVFFHSASESDEQ